ncbi:MAG TPA: BadF/BadG/BcrA/BcrD ATPase family protein, partial [Anaerolineales bacterium]|nr:BadF/BadG/BcrA/BcrD ATPase family protein [Anaerolineales bacterium]
GRTARAGGWGWALGDEGSGFAIGLGALRAIARATDGRGPETALRDVILQRWALTNPEALVATVYRHPFPRIEIASLAAVVEAVAETGDAVARGLLVEAGRELTTGVASVVRALALSSPVPLALGGSVLVHGRLAAAALIDSLAEQGVACEPVGRVEEPALGALSMQFKK